MTKTIIDDTEMAINMLAVTLAYLTKLGWKNKLVKLLLFREKVRRQVYTYIVGRLVIIICGYVTVYREEQQTLGVRYPPSPLGLGSVEVK